MNIHILSALKPTLTLFTALLLAPLAALYAAVLSKQCKLGTSS